MLQVSTLVKWLEDPSQYRNFKELLAKIKAGDTAVFRLCESAAMASFESATCPLAQKMHALKLLKEVVMTGNLDIIDAIDPKTIGYLKRVAEYRIGEPDDKSRLFMELEGRPQNKEVKSIGAAFHLFTVESILNWAVWIQKESQPDETNQFKTLKAELLKKGLKPPAAYTYYKKEEQAIFSKNVGQWNDAEPAPAPSAPPPPPASSQSGRDKPAELSSKLASLKDQRDHLKTLLQQQKSSAQSESTSLREELKRLGDELAQAQRELEQLKKENEALAASVEAKTGELKKSQGDKYSELERQVQAKDQEIVARQKQFQSKKKEMQDELQVSRKRQAGLRQELESLRAKENALRSQLQGEKREGKSLAQSLARLKLSQQPSSQRKEGSNRVRVQKIIRDPEAVRQIERLQEELKQLQAQSLSLQVPDQPRPSRASREQERPRGRGGLRREGGSYQVQCQQKPQLFQPMSLAMQDLRKVTLKGSGFFYQTGIFRLGFKSVLEGGELKAYLSVQNKGLSKGMLGVRLAKSSCFEVREAVADTELRGGEESTSLLKVRLLNHQVKPLVAKIKLGRVRMYIALPISILSFCSPVQGAGPFQVSLTSGEVPLASYVSLDELEERFEGRSCDSGVALGVRLGGRQFQTVVAGKGPRRVQVSVGCEEEDRPTGEMLLQSWLFLLRADA